MCNNGIDSWLDEEFEYWNLASPTADMTVNQQLNEKELKFDNLNAYNIKNNDLKIQEINEISEDLQFKKLDKLSNPKNDKIKIEGLSLDKENTQDISMSRTSGSPKSITKTEICSLSSNSNTTKQKVNKIKKQGRLNERIRKNSKKEQSKRGKSKKSNKKIKSRSRYHYESNNQDLSKRKDVVNKTLLRSIKRYYSWVFQSDIQKYFKAQKDKIS